MTVREAIERGRRGAQNFAAWHGHSSVAKNAYRRAGLPEPIYSPAAVLDHVGRRAVAGSVYEMNTIPEAIETGVREVNIIDRLVEFNIFVSALTGNQRLKHTALKAIESYHVRTSSPTHDKQKTRELMRPTTETDKGKISSKLLVELIMGLRATFDHSTLEQLMAATPSEMVSVLFGKPEEANRSALLDRYNHNVWNEAITARLGLALPAAGLTITLLEAVLKEPLTHEKGATLINALKVLGLATVNAGAGALLGRQIGKKFDGDNGENKWRTAGTIGGAVAGATLATGAEVVTLGSSGGSIGSDLAVAGGVVGIASADMALMRNMLLTNPKEVIERATSQALSFLQQSRDMMRPEFSVLKTAWERRLMKILNERVSVQGNTEQKMREAIGRKARAFLGTALSSVVVPKGYLSMLPDVDLAKPVEAKELMKPLTGNSASITLYQSMLAELVRTMKPGGLTQIIAPQAFKDYADMAGAEVLQATDAMKGDDHLTALRIWNPTGPVYLFHDFFLGKGAFKNKTPESDSRDFAARGENTAGSGVVRNTMELFWESQVGRTGQSTSMRNYMTRIAEDLNGKGATERSTMSLIGLPPLYQELLNTLVTARFAHTLNGKRGAEKHFENALEKVLAEAPNDPIKLTHVLMFISYAKAAVLAAPFFKELGYDGQIIDHGVDTLREIVDYTVQRLFTKYTTNPTPLLKEQLPPEEEEQFTTMLQWIAQEAPETLVNNVNIGNLLNTMISACSGHDNFMHPVYSSSLLDAIGCARDSIVGGQAAKVTGSEKAAQEKLVVLFDELVSSMVTRSIEGNYSPARGLSSKEADNGQLDKVHTFTSLALIWPLNRSVTGLTKVRDCLVSIYVNSLLPNMSQFTQVLSPNLTSVPVNVRQAQKVTQMVALLLPQLKANGIDATELISRQQEFEEKIRATNLDFTKASSTLGVT